MTSALALLPLLRLAAYQATTRRGILFKNALALETSARIQTVVMDKTGTPTKGEPEVTGVTADGLPEREVLRLAAAVERESEHPLAEAVVKHADGLGIPAARAAGFENVPGYGALAQVEGTIPMSDPIFWMHHADIDRLWWQWQQAHPGQNPSVSGTGPDSPVMDPWPYTEADTRDITAMGYTYA